MMMPYGRGEAEVAEVAEVVGVEEVVVVLRSSPYYLK